MLLAKQTVLRSRIKLQYTRAMVDAINQIGHVMGIETVCEFVENEAIVQVLRDIGVDYAQGYHIGKPIPLAEL